MESFFSNYVNTISALSMLGTWAAIIIALWLARLSSKPNLKILVDMVKIIPEEAQSGGIKLSECNSAIGVTFQNRGQTVAFIGYYGFFWKLPWPCRTYLNQFPETNFRLQDPLRIEPGQSITITLTSDITALRQGLKDLCNESNLPIFLIKFTKFKFATPDGRTFSAKLGKSLQKSIKGL